MDDVIELLEEREETKRCIKPKCELWDSLNIVYNEASSLFMLWNKYQIFAYEDYNFEFPTKTFIPEFNLRKIVNCNNYLVCLDTTGNIHINSLKFKNSAQKRFKSSFQPKQQGILCCEQYTPDSIIAIRFDNENNFVLYLYQINSDLQTEKQLILNFKEDQPQAHSNYDKYLLFTHKINREEYEVVKEIFDADDCETRDYSIVLITFDKITVYGCLFSPKMPKDEIVLVKLYTSPVEICDVKIIDNNNINIIIGLTIGTIIKIQLKHETNVEEIHLNIAISKFITSNVNEMIIYSNGVSMWKSENSLSKNITLTQFFLKQVKDYVRFGDNIICTTYSRSIYIFPLEADDVYVKLDPSQQYYEATNVLRNSEYFYSMRQELKKNEELSTKTDKESSYLIALALSKRPDVMDKSISHQVSIYDEYYEALKDNLNVTLTDELKSYFEPDTFCVYVKITAIMVHQMYNKILTHLFGDLKIHINFVANNKLIRTTSIKINETLKTVELLLPFNVKKINSLTELKVIIKLVVNVPGSFDTKQSIWVILYEKQKIFNAKHFIKSSTVNNVDTYKRNESIEDLILQTALNYHGKLFHVTNLSTLKTNNGTLWSLCVKLPNNYSDLLSAETYYKERLTNISAKKAEYLIKMFSSEEFLRLGTKSLLEIGKDKVILEIELNFFKPFLKVMGDNLKVVYNIRNFIANLIHGEYENYSSQEAFIPHATYTSVENIQKSIKNAVLNGLREDFPVLVEKFHITVYGEIPL